MHVSFAHSISHANTFKCLPDADNTYALIHRLHPPTILTCCLRCFCYRIPFQFAYLEHACTLGSAHKRSCLIAQTTGCAGLRALAITCVHICIFTHIHTRACVMVHARYRALLTHAFVGTQTHRSAYINRMERTHSVSVAPEPHSTDLLDNQNPQPNTLNMFKFVSGQLLPPVCICP